MKNKKKNYKVVRNIATITIIAGLSYALNTYNENINKIPYTNQDTITNITFNKELDTIINTSYIEFQNEELYNIIEQQLGDRPTKENLATITFLEIKDKLNNSDLSDLRYLQNLETLEISNNDINLSDIKYNQNLKSLNIDSCILKNTTDIPNSTETLIITNSSINDNSLITPFFLKKIYIENTPISNLAFKNPSTLEELHIIGDVILDFNNIKSCTNLNKLTLKLCSNVTNSHILNQLPNLKTIELDDYASIWLSVNTIEQLPLNEETKECLLCQIKQLDNIYSSIINENDSDCEKVKNISLYILGQLSYDENISNDYNGNIEKVLEYNANPIESSLTKEQAICINYSCLFKALLNRTGLENYQLFSNIHTWNIVSSENGYQGYDLTYLDDKPLVNLSDNKIALVSDATVEQILKDNNGSLLHYYGFNLEEITDEDHLAKLAPQEIKDIIINIGYINENNLQSNRTITNISLLLKIMLILLITNTFINIYKNKSEKTKKYQKESQGV